MPTPTSNTVILPPRLFGSVGYYVAMANARRAIIDTGMRYDKRNKAVHRYDIADVRGPMQLTVPLARPHGCQGVPTWADAAVSTHDEWWIRHRITLESAYGRTPFFEFIIDRFDGIFRSPAAWPQWPAAIDIARYADEAVRTVLSLPHTEVLWQPAGCVMQHDLDLRRADFSIAPQHPYWQIRADRLGFLPNLSVLDLIFNLGPEASLYLTKIN